MTGEQKPGGLEVGRDWLVQIIKEHTFAADAADMILERYTPAEPAEARIRELEARVNHLTLGCAKQNDEVCQVLGRALGYPAFVDDQVNFPGATEADGVCVGDHVAESMADEAARRISAAEAKLARAREERSNAVGVGMVIAATIILPQSDVYAEEVLGAAGICSIADMRKIGCDDYDINQLRGVVSEMQRRRRYKKKALQQAGEVG